MFCFRNKSKYISPMKKVISLFSIILVLNITSNSQVNSSEFNTFLTCGFSNFSTDSLNCHFERLVNIYRNSVGSENSYYEKSLVPIAQDQSDYCLNNNKLTHYQRENPLKEDPWVRGEFYNSKYEVFSENLLSGQMSTSMISYYTKGVNFYDLISIYLIDGWKNSPKHNESMISRYNSKFAVSLSLSNNTIYSCMIMVTLEEEN